MRINSIQQQNRSFGSGLHHAQREFIKAANARNITRALMKNGIECDFKNNDLMAGLCAKGAAICRSLQLRPPEKIKSYYSHADVLGKAANDDGPINIYLNKKFFGKGIAKWNKECNKFEERHGTTHALCPIIHEFVHADHLSRLKHKHDNVYMKLISLDKFKDEINEKIGTFANTNPMELIAVYWTKEICNSLGKDWLPRYNPLTSPKIQLSSELKEFMNAVNNGDLNKAMIISNR